MHLLLTFVLLIQATPQAPLEAALRSTIAESRTEVAVALRSLDSRVEVLEGSTTKNRAMP